jgi:hypothetical protein
LVAPIVEGHGEVHSIRPLLERIGQEQLGGAGIDAIRPFRCPKSKLVRGDWLPRVAGAAVAKLRQAAEADDRLLLLVLLDADEDCPADLGPRLLGTLRSLPIPVACVLANKEYESWFVAAAESLTAYLEFEDPPPESPEQSRSGKGWIQQRYRRSRAASYSETIDQPAMTAAMDLALCRRRSPSFDKLCRVLAAAT